MSDARTVYDVHPGEYDALVRREDREGNLLVIDTHNHRLRLVGLATR